MTGEELLEKYAQGERKFHREKLIGANLTEAKLVEIHLYKADLTEIDLSRANLTNANLSQADLSKASLSDVNFTRANLENVSFHKANLQRADMKLANLSKSDLSEVNLTDGYLVGATLEDTNLKKACLEGASLEAANLHNANLSSANLNGANLRKADLTDANIYGTTFDNADLTDAIMPDGEIYNQETSTNKQPNRRKPMERQIIKTDSAPAPVGPYNQAIAARGQMLFVSGQIAIDTRLNEIVYTDDVAKQTEQVMNNLEGILVAAGAQWSNVVKTTVFLKDMNDFATVNGIYAKYFDADTAPARACVEVSRLPKDVLVEIDCIAVV